MTDRRWKAGQSFTVAGLDFRVRRGRKSDDDLVLDYRLPSGWTPIPMAVTFAMVDFFYENENRLYPPPQYQGGEYLMKALRRATKHGWSVAARVLDEEKKSGQRGVQEVLLPADDAPREAPRPAIFDFDEEAA